MLHMVDFAEPLEPEENEEPDADAAQPDGATGPVSRVDDDVKAAIEGWTEALRSVQRSIDEAAEAIRFLRRTMQEMAPLWQSLSNLEDALRGAEHSTPEPHRLGQIESQWATAPPPVAPVFEEQGREEAGPAPDAITASWQAPAEQPQEEARKPVKRRPEETERLGSWREPPEEPAPVAMEPRASLKPVTLVPDDTIAAYSYRMTVEEPGKPVELVPLHQALSSVAAIRNLSLVGYMNGVASIAIESTEEILAAEVENAITKTMKQECSVITHDESTLLVQIGEKARSH
jgi:hypothetical protein